MIPFSLLFLIVAMAALAAFGLGYDAARRHNDWAERQLISQLRLAETQRHQLSQWIEDNWPTEYAAYRQGHEEGYQQALSHAPDLLDEADQP